MTPKEPIVKAVKRLYRNDTPNNSITATAKIDKLLRYTIVCKIIATSATPTGNNIKKFSPMAKSNTAAIIVISNNVPKSTSK
jgi:hypothetical protein